MIVQKQQQQLLLQPLLQLRQIFEQMASAQGYRLLCRRVNSVALFLIRSASNKPVNEKLKTESTITTCD
ncbi:unnamed protein product [Gongylonema pulchrum]|uniref:Uncharacterized protein n=1 Tax=Gongylonema pulchrum TaxID=637853 RepID=A0A183F0N6_9BILA|nr:unnamed protein product [Gongylonema pulchrum]